MLDPRLPNKIGLSLKVPISLHHVFPVQNISAKRSPVKISPVKNISNGNII